MSTQEELQFYGQDHQERSLDYVITTRMLVENSFSFNQCVSIKLEINGTQFVRLLVLESDAVFVITDRLSLCDFYLDVRAT